MTDGPRPAQRRPEAPRPPGFVSAQLLIDLVNNTLDPGYAAAARRREQRERDGRGTRRRIVDPPLAALGALLIGFLLVVAYVHTNRGAPEAQQVHDRLVERVRDARDGADALAGQLNRGEKELDRLQAAALPSSGPLAQSLARAQLEAGQLAARGPGLVVTLGEPPAPSPTAQNGRGGSVPITATHILTDRDVRAVVNQLWSDGAEAVAVNNVRLTPTSAIRFAGEAVLVDFQPLTSPYTITAIGDGDRLSVDFAQSAVASKYQTLRGVSGVRFSFSNKSDVSVPASSALTLRYASPATSAPAKKTKSKRRESSAPSAPSTGPSR